MSFYSSRSVGTQKPDRSIVVFRAVRLLSIALIFASASAFDASAADPLPDRPIKMIVAVGTGGATDVLARRLAERMQSNTGHAVYVENMPSGSGVVGALAVAKAAPDGATILIGTPTTHASNKVFIKNLAYDPIKDFEPIARLGSATYVLCIDKSLPVKSVGELIAYAKANPGKLTFGSGTGSARVAGEMFKAKAGVDILSVPYRGNAAALTDLLGGRLSMIFGDWTLMQPHVKSGACRALAVSSPTRSPLAPELPTMQEAGVPGYQLEGFIVAFAPAKTPSNVVDWLNTAMVSAIKEKEFNDFLLTNGMEPTPSTPAEAKKYIADEAGRWDAIGKAAGIQPE